MSIEYNIFNWKNIIVYIFLLFDSYYFDAFTKWNLLFNFLHFSGIVKFSAGFMCCLSSIISVMFYSAMTKSGVKKICQKKNMGIKYAIFMDVAYHIIPLLYWNYFCLINNIKILLEEALFVILLYISWIRSRSYESNSYKLEAWDASHIYVKYNYKIPFIYGLYGSIITMLFINKKNIYYNLIPIFHIILSQLNNYLKFIN